jgi:hypothetical protein
MPNTVVNLGDLRELATKYSRALDKHDGIRLKQDGKPGGTVNSDDLQAVADALKTVRRLVGEICEQPVLAVRLIEQKSATARTKAGRGGKKK